MGKGLDFFCVGVVAGLAGCANQFNFSGDKLQSAVRDNGVVVHFNGLFSDTLEDVSGDIAGEFGMAHISGECTETLFDVLRLAENSKYGVNVILYSVGSGDAVRLARKCYSRGIDIRGVYSLGAFTGEDYPDGKIVNYFSSIPHIFGEQASRGKSVLTERLKSGHYDLPRLAKDSIRGHIARGDVCFRKRQR